MTEKKVVYIEDDRDLIDLVTRILRPRGIQVIGAIDGQTGLDLIHSLQPDLVLLDLMLPVMDGWEVYKRLSVDPGTKNVPVIIVTAKSQPIDQVLGKQIVKVDGYITKPFNPSELVDCLDQIFKEKLQP